MIFSYRLILKPSKFLIKFAILRPRSTMDSIRVSEAPDPSSILGEATKKNPTDRWDFFV